nr:HAD-IC family P-type ATPase [Candidatus Sigynarchaeota archaeon]
MGQNLDDAKSLSELEARDLLSQHGFNEIPEARHNPLRGILKRLWGPIPWMLEAAIVLEMLLGKVVEALIIAVLLGFSAGVGETQELRARTALGYLRSHLQVTTQVRRDGSWRAIQARELVPGDLIRVKTGDIVPADSIIRDGTVDVDQSSLTGESAVVSRSIGDPIYSGSTVRLGDAIGTVKNTGSRSYFGKTAELVKTARSPSHLEQLLFKVVRYLAIIDGILAVMLVGAALWTRADLIPLIPFLIVLVIVTVPVSMPASFTVANALEARGLAKEGVLVTGLSAMQEVGTMEVLCVDKTGTLTRNQQTIAALVPISGIHENELLTWAAAACDESMRDALNVVIFQEFKRRELVPFIRQKFIPFNPAAKRSEAYVTKGDQACHVLMGSPLVIIPLVGTSRELETTIEELSARGARVLAVAAGTEGHMTLQGLVALADTPREDAAKFVKALQSLAIRILMITGDTVATAQTIGEKVGIGNRIGTVEVSLKEPLKYDGIANIYPEDKYRIVKALQGAHLITGMTGDGINDAPALKQAEVGIAVSTASDVAKASAKVVLTEPGLQDIVKVVSGGRRVHRRMLTWTVTKIARTVELTVLLTLGYMITGFFVTPLFLIILIVVLNDLVTIALGTDRAWVSPVPERWNVGAIAEVASMFAAGWLILGFVILWTCMSVFSIGISQVQTLMFVYLIFSAQATIYMTRVRDHFWSYAPSRFVIMVTTGDMIVTSLLATVGIMMTPIPVLYVIILLGVVAGATLVLDQVKILIFRKTGILGTSNQDRPLVTEGKGGNTDPRR